MINPSHHALLLALLAAKAKRPKLRLKRKEDREVGTGTNERGPQVETNSPPNSFPEDGDHS